VRSVGEEDANAIAAGQPYFDIGELARRAPADRDALQALVASGACDAWGERRALLWRLGVTPRPAGGQLTLSIGPTAETPTLPQPVYEAHRAIVRGEPLLLARGRFERVERNENLVVEELETLGGLARRVAGEAEVGNALPRAHHFGHR